MWEKAVTEPCGPAPNAAGPLSRGQHGKKSMVRVGGVSDNNPSSGHAAFGSNILNGGERTLWSQNDDFKIWHPKKKIGTENKTSTEKGNIVIETFVLKTVVLALKQVLALKKETN